MSRLKTISFGLALTIVPVGAAEALDDLTREFAYCAGRYSAEMEHAWLLSDPAADVSEGKRAAFVELLDAVAPVGSGRSVLNYRISAKVAHAALLSRASFAEDSEIQENARIQARRHLGACDRFLLQG